MFRIYCQFRPNVKRAAGADSMGPRQGRGAWVVTACLRYVTPVPYGAAVINLTHEVAVLCPTPRRDGTRCNPRKMLAEYQEHQRTVRWVNRIAAQTGWPNA